MKTTKCVEYKTRGTFVSIKVFKNTKTCVKDTNVLTFKLPQCYK